MAVEMHRKLIPLMVLVLATSTQGGYLHSSSSHAHTHHGSSSYTPQSHYASSHAQYAPAQLHSSAYTGHAPAGQSYIASQPALLPQPAYSSQGQYTPSYSSAQYSPQNAYQYSSVPAVAAPIRQTTVSHSQALPASYATHAPSQVNYASSVNAYVTQNAVAAPSVSYAATGSLQSQSALYPASISYGTSQITHSAYPASQATHLSQPLTHTYAPGSQTSFAAVSAPLPAQSSQYSSSQSYSSQNPSVGHAITYSVPHNDYNYLKQYKQGDYHFQTGSAPVTTSIVQQTNQQNHQLTGQHYHAALASPISTSIVPQTSQQNHQITEQHHHAASASPITTSVVQQTSPQNHQLTEQHHHAASASPISTSVVQQTSQQNHQLAGHHYHAASASPITTSVVQQTSPQNHQLIGQHYHAASASPITTTVVQHNGDRHQVTSSNSGGYHYQAGSSSAAPVTTTVVHHNGDQHQVTRSNNGYSYQVTSSAASAAVPAQHSSYQHQVPSGNNGYHYAAGTSLDSPLSTTVAHHQSGHHEVSGNSNSGGYQYQTGFQPIPITVVQHNGNHHEVSGSSVYSSHVDSSHSVTHQSGSINLDDSYSHGYSQAYSAPTSVVTKHIYFHAPPEDVEERPHYSVPVSPPKKTYNIVFIKVPSQENRHGSTLQSLAVAPQAQIEDKTLIYVLVKKPDPQEVLVQQPAPKVNSQHEVFYVKYKGDVGEVAHQINKKLSQQGSLQAAQLQQSSAGYEQSPVISAPLLSEQQSLQVVHHGSAHTSGSQSNVVTEIEQQQLISAEAGLQSLQPPHPSLPGLSNGHH